MRSVPVVEVPGGATPTGADGGGRGWGAEGGACPEGHGAGLGRLGPGVRQRRQLCNENALSTARPCT